MNEVEKRELAAKVSSGSLLRFRRGVTVKGIKSLDQLRREWELLQLPDLAGKSVLDLNTWDGWFALQAERCGLSGWSDLIGTCGAWIMAEHS